mmetsp:Transcript_30724/g.81723  ORF Transcript_30724/g.81723 Transcript_30724/m.81723 type:complete len:289 (+) Transcript_30724:543-1409(+)
MKTPEKLHHSFVHTTLSTRPLSWAAPRVYFYPNFLSPSECTHLIDYARTHPKFKDGAADSSVYFGWHDHYKDKILASIETRIGVVTGIPPHGDEEPINVHHVPVKGSIPDDPRHLNIHHDKVQKEYSAATVLVYLTNSTVGGGTIWPCSAKLADGSTVRQECKEGFEANVRWFDGEKSTIKGVPKRVSVETEVHEEMSAVRQLAIDGCAATTEEMGAWRNTPARTSGGDSGVTAGSAVVFFHNHPDGSPDPFAWHAGCPALSEDKWTMQKFKELPMAFRKKEDQPRRR